MKKIVHCICSFNVGGAETMLVDIMNEQVLKYEVTLVILNDSYSQSLLDKLVPAVKIVKINRPSGSRNPWYIALLNYRLLLENMDVLHLHSSSLSGLIFGFRSRAFYTCHDVGVRFAPHKVSRVFAISHSVAEDIRIRYGYDNVSVVPNGINVEAILPREPRLGDGLIRIVNVARLNHQKKGQDILIKAIALLRDRGLDNLSVAFIGEGDSRELLEKLSEDLNVSEQVRFLGLKDRDYIYQHLCDYDLMCHPSRYEGFGLTVAEGMAANLPVLVSTGDGPCEIIGQGKYGFSFENGSAESCADALEYMVRNYDDIVAKVDIARKHIESEYSVKRMVAQYIQAYTE
ncbi:glycosyltransferase [Porphyromonas gingivalis]|uniref:glycosyltransferase n=1 Tax=Porphyromonas gingivalis TaxID=837 RepID=UPI000C1A688C|nr:glycosyltransferase [Porphyromonas gingivalis]ATR99196.1 glycosyltransferase [Porphyromonas gingivalis]